MDLSFSSDLPIDRLVFTPNMPGGSGSVTISGAFGTFNISNDLGTRFVASIGYSDDGGDTWIYNGAPTIDGNIMTVLCLDDIITVYYSSISPGSSIVMYRIYGISREA